MYRRLMCVSAALITAAVGLAAPAVASAATVPTVRAASVADTSPTVTPGVCTYATMTASFSDPDYLINDPELYGYAQNTETGRGMASSTVSMKRSGSRVTYQERLRLCGLDAGHEPSDTGKYTWKLTVPYGSRGYLAVSRTFHLRTQGIVSFNATPEPVTRGGLVTLKASVGDGWEGTEPTTMTFYFRAEGAEKWTYKGKVKSHCVSDCEDWPLNEARLQVRQQTSGTWKAVSRRTSWLESGSRSDYVAVR